MEKKEAEALARAKERAAKADSLVDECEAGNHRNSSLINSI